MMLRQVPPTATPLRWGDWRSGLRPGVGVVAEFAAALAAYLAVPHCYLASSGRTALFLLLSTLRRLPEFESRSEVVLPAYTCPSVAKVVLNAGLLPRLVDIDPRTHGYILEALPAAVGSRTLAVICVHPFGLPQPVAPVLALAYSWGAVVVEDGAQALGAHDQGRPVGTRGDFGLFSLGPGKPLSTGGGGVLCTGNSAYAQALAAEWRTLAEPGGPAALWAWARLGLFSLAFHPTGWWLAAKAGVQRVGDREDSWGYALRGLAPSQAAVGLRILSMLDAINRMRQARAEEWLREFGALHGVRLPAVGANGLQSGASDQSRGAGEPPEAIFLRLPLVVEEEALADRLLGGLRADGIGAGRMYRRTLAEIFPELAQDRYPGAEQVARGLLTLPTNHHVTRTDIRRGVRRLRRILG